MGFFKLVMKSVSQLGNEAKQPTTASSELASSSIGFPIVGEYYKPESFEAIKVKLNASIGESIEVEALVQNDPKNRYSKNGKAVAVYIFGNHVGFISEDKSAHIFDLLKNRGGKGTCKAIVRFNSTPEEPSNSVELQIKWPPAFEDQVSNSETKIDSYKLNASGVLFDPELLPFINGTSEEFFQHSQGFSLVPKLLKLGAEAGDKFIFDNTSYLESLITTKHKFLGKGEVGLILMGELVAKISEQEGNRLFDLVDKKGGFAAVTSKVIFGEEKVSYIANVGSAKLSSSQSNRIQRPPLIKGTFSGIAEVDSAVTSRSEDNLDYQVDLIGLDVGQTAFVIGNVCLFDGQKSDNVFVQYGDTIGGIEGYAKEVLRPFISKYGHYDGSKTSLGVWMMISRKSAKKTKVEVFLDNPLVIEKV